MWSTVICSVSTIRRRSVATQRGSSNMPDDVNVDESAAEMTSEPEIEKQSERSDVENCRRVSKVDSIGSFHSEMDAADNLE